jgi:hypothetical protein
MYISIDDTDTIDSRGTGELAELLAKGLEANGWGITGKVTRHQLFVHPDIPYTSHNSSMCFPLDDVDEHNLDNIIAYSENFLKQESAAGSDPGLCIANVDNANVANNIERLIEFGKLAKKYVLQKGDAYSLAAELDIHLSEHGGTGQGVIGALAGIGLRLSGNDGRYKGKYKLANTEKYYSVADICRETGIDIVRVEDGDCLPLEDKVYIDQPIKTVLLNGKETLLVMIADGVDDELTNKNAWVVVPKQRLKKY